MATPPRLRDSVIAAKQRLLEGRAKLKLQHAAGTPGRQLCAHLSDLLDTAVLDIYDAALEELDEKSLLGNLALVPHGGFGRRDVAPFSDIDLMLLHHPRATRTVKVLAQRLLADLSDLGVPVGFSVRTPNQACRLARRDPIILSSLVESRYLSGSVGLFRSYLRRFHQQAHRRSGALLNSIQAARDAERRQYGETVYLLEPNVKRSLGTLREIHLLRWIGFTRYGESRPETLRRRHFLSEDDERKVRTAYEFLLRLRNELHFHAGRPDDVLYREEQVRIAELWGFAGSESLLPVEQFMQVYFQHTRAVRDVVENFSASAKPRCSLTPLLSPLVTHRMEQHYRVGPLHISANREGREKLQGNLAEVLQLMNLANLTAKFIDHRTWNTIRVDMLRRGAREVSPEAAERFLNLLSHPARLGELLRRLHELGVLEKLVVGWDHARCLLQFNKYHKYTVDEHCIRAVEFATTLQLAGGPVAEAYQEIKDKALLHLALLIHDLGKGQAGDHSEVGARLAGDTARRLHLGWRRTELLKFLVHKHLTLSHLAFRRDTGEQATIVKFASEVGSPEYLRMLYVLTAADLAAVGPGVLTPWKTEVLTAAYRRAMHHVSGGSSFETGEHGDHRRQQLLAAAPSDHREWYERQIAALPPAYLQDHELPIARQDLQRLQRLDRRHATAWANYLEDRGATEYTIGVYSQLVHGTFHRLTGALTSKGLQILSANIYTLADGLLMDRFYVEDVDYEGAPPPERLQSVLASLICAVEQPTDEPPKFRRVWQATKRAGQQRLEVLPTRVVIDNSTLAAYTIVDVFTNDRVGLLYAITRTLYEQNVAVHFAKIGTFLDQVVDVFYVTERGGGKISSESRLNDLQQQLLTAIETVRVSSETS